jgi:hypothetical protein
LRRPSAATNGGEHLAGEVGEGAAGEGGGEAVARDGGAHGLPGVEAEGREAAVDEVEALVVVESAEPQGREGGRVGGGHRVGAAHLQRVGEPNLREQRLQVRLPVAHRGPVAREPLGHEAPEGEVRRGEDLGVALDDKHRHVEGPADIVAEADVGRPREGQEARAVVVHVEPHRRAVRGLARAHALDHWGVGEERRHEGRQRQARAELTQGVALGGEVEIGLHRGRAAHHVEAVRAARGQVRAHDGVAGLGHPIEVVLAGEGVKADAQEGEAAHRLGQGRHLVAVLEELVVHRVGRGVRRAGELKLRAGLEGDALLAAHEHERRPAGLLGLRGPALSGLHLREEPRDAGPRGAVGVAQGGAVGEEPDALGLHPDQPGFRAKPPRKHREEVGLVAQLSFVSRHH